MKTVEIHDATAPLADYARQARKEAVMVTFRGKPFATVMSVPKGADWESLAVGRPSQVPEDCGAVAGCSSQPRRSLSGRDAVTLGSSAQGKGNEEEDVPSTATVRSGANSTLECLHCRGLLRKPTAPFNGKPAATEPRSAELKLGSKCVASH
jgi:hypothetical protein